MKKLGVLINGAGWVSTQHIAAFQANPNTEIVAISSRRLESCQQRAEEAGLEDALLTTDFEDALKRDDVDIVSVCTPQHIHAENAIAAAQAGKHIVIEKPIANSLEEIRAMLDAVKKALEAEDYDGMKSALDELNQKMQAAATEMYAQARQQGAESAPGADAGESTGGEKQATDVEEADFEMMDDEEEDKK